MVNAAIGAVVIDDTMSAAQIVEVGDQFRNFNVDTLTKYQLPTYGAGGDGFSYQEIDWDDAEPMLDVFRGIDQGQEVVPRMVQIEVDRSASPIGDAFAVESALEERGFDVDLSRRASDRPSTTSRQGTTISYGPDGAQAAALLARHLDGRWNSTRTRTSPACDCDSRPAATSSPSAPRRCPPKRCRSPRSPARPSGRPRPSRPPPFRPTRSTAKDPGGEPSGPTTTVPGFVPVDDTAVQSC